MKLHLENAEGYKIKRYDPQSVTINDVVYNNNLIVLPEHLQTWEVDSFEALTLVHFENIARLKPELVLLGTGLKLRFPPSELFTPLLQQGIGVDVMDLYAACRTYNILMGEGRNVAAALLIR